MSSVLSYESLVHAVAGAVVRRGLHARASMGVGLCRVRPGTWRGDGRERADGGLGLSGLLDAEEWARRESCLKNLR
jgi:hypothetical protein